ncbi:hypothetical protein QQ045_028726 [Rhodiola kirilowii]
MKRDNKTEYEAIEHRKLGKVIRGKRIHSSAAVESSPQKCLKNQRTPTWPNSQSSSKTNFKSSVERRPHFFKEFQQYKSLPLQLELVHQQHIIGRNKPISRYKHPSRTKPTKLLTGVNPKEYTDDKKK